MFTYLQMKGKWVEAMLNYTELFLVFEKPSIPRYRGPVTFFNLFFITGSTMMIHLHHKRFFYKLIQVFIVLKLFNNIRSAQSELEARKIRIGQKKFTNFRTYDWFCEISVKIHDTNLHRGYSAKFPSHCK